MIKLNIKTMGGVGLTVATKNYVEKKIKHLERFIDPKDKTVFAVVEMGKSTKHHHAGDYFKAEIRLHLAGKNLVAVCEEEDLYAAIDKMKDEITGEIIAYRQKKTRLLRKGGRDIKRIIQGTRAN